MKTFKSTTIKSIIGSSKVIIEVPHQRSANLYDTNLKMTDYISDNSTTRLRESLSDLSHAFVCRTLGDLMDAFNSSVGHQQNRRQILIKRWCIENLTGAQYLSLFGEMKSKNDE